MNDHQKLSSIFIMHLFISKDYHFKNQLEKFIKMIKIILEDLF